MTESRIPCAACSRAHRCSPTTRDLVKELARRVIEKAKQRVCKDVTLEWREKYRPWCVSEETVRFNDAGFVYHRDHSRTGKKRRAKAKLVSAALPNPVSQDPVALLAGEGHAMVYYRPGLASPSEDPELYGRAMINTLEMAVADSLARNGGRIGRFNVVMDCDGLSSHSSPSIADVRRLFSVLQDHFPDRLGVLLAANLSLPARTLMRMVLPFVTEDVRAKIHIIPDADEERREMLSQFIDLGEVPYYLGGEDGHRFDAKEYYQETCVLPEEGILEYKTTMPYHA